MATVTKDFRIKSGLVVEGTNGTINGSDIITEDAITGGTQTNISVTYDAQTKTVSFAAENGVADSTTDDLTEGDDNLYFTNQRAIDAVGGSASSDNEPNTVVKRDGEGDFAAREVTVGKLKASNGDTIFNSSNSFGEPELTIGSGPGSTSIKSTSLQSGAVSLNSSGINLSSGADIVAGGSLQTPVYDGLNNAHIGKFRANKEGTYDYDVIGKDMSDKPVVRAHTYHVGENSGRPAVISEGMSGDVTVTAATVSAGVLKSGGSGGGPVPDTAVYLGNSSSFDNYIASHGYVNGRITTHADDTSTHGVGEIVGTTEAQTLSNKTLGSGTSLGSALDANFKNINNLGYPENDKDAATKQYADDQIEAHSDLTTGVHGVSGDVVGTSDAQTLTNKTMGDDLLMDGNQISGLPMPDQADHAASKAYVDSVAEGLHIHASVVAASTQNEAIGPLAGAPTIDGVELVDTNRVLLKNQTNPAENGIYVYTGGGSIRLDRAADFDSPAEVDGGDFVFVTGGNTQADTGWVQTSDAVVTIGNDPIYFTQFSGAGTFLAGNGLLLNSNTFEIDDSITATKTYVQDNFVAIDDLPGQLDDYIPLTQKAANDGVATLDENGQVPTNQLGNVTTVIDGLTTADIEEDPAGTGTSGTLYFTDARAVSALEAVVPNFTAVDINDVAKEVAVSGIPTAGNPTAVLSWDSDIFPSLKAIVMFRTSSHTEISEILLTMDSSNNFAITEYAVVGTNGTLGTIEPEYFGAGNGSALKATTVNSGTTVTIKATLLNPYTV